MFNFKGDLWWQYDTTGGTGYGAFAQITAHEEVFSYTSALVPSYVATTPFSIVATEKTSLVVVDTSTTAITLNLPYANGFNSGKLYLIQDATGNAAAQNITITPQSTDIIGTATAGTSYTISTNYGSVWLMSYFTGSVWVILNSN